MIADNGTVAVVATEPAQPPSLSATVAGNQLTLSWPTDYVTYVLQAQTNSISIGLSTNWTSLPGVSGNTAVIQIDSANPAVFYRLVKP